MLVGLPTRQSLLEFLVEKKSRVVDSAVCYYQRKPVVLVCGGMQRLWPLIAPMRRYCDFLPAGSLNDAQKSLRARALPDLVLVEQGWGSGDSMVLLASECKARGVSWIVAALETPSVGEVAALSAGAAEFLTVDANLELARLRFERVLRDRLSVEERQRGVSTDGLTGLGSRRRFTQKIEGEWARLCRQQKPVSLLLIDIDLFAEFNEDYGYLVGDESLERLAGLWDVVVTRPSDMLARFGGNQVIGLFPGSDATALSPLAERMRALAVEANIEHEQSEYDAKLTVSIGLASCIPDQESSVHELLDLVHEACGEAREAGGNQVVVRLA
jgi:diguanylate cyclase (GGDEF)-like protein